MKKLKYLMFVVAAACVLVGCKKPVEVSFESASQEMDARGDSVEMMLKSNGEWMLNSTAEWLTVSPMSGSGDATLTLVAEPNTGQEPRTAEISASTKDKVATLTVTQLGSQYYCNVTPHEIQCGNEGGEFTVTVSSNIDWMVSVPQWMTSSVSQGSNDATITLTISPILNEISVERDANVIIGNLVVSDKVHVVQSEATGPTISITPQSMTFVCTGETKTVNVTTEDSWTAVASSDWVVLSVDEGQGSAEVSVTAEANPEYTGRRASVVFTTAGGRQTILGIQQEATPDPHFLEVSPRAFQFPKEGGNAEITIGCDTDWDFDLVSDWLSLSQSSGTGNATVTLTATSNPIMEPRQQLFYIKSGELVFDLSVTQAAGDQLAFADFEQDSLFVSYSGGVVHVEMTSNTSWQLEASNWITLLTTSGSGDASFDIAVSSNANPEERTGYVRVKHNGQELAVLTVVQEGKVDILETDITEMDVRPEGGSFTVHITANQSWTVNSDVNWLHYVPASGFGPGTLTITVDAMMSARPRTGHVKISGANGADVTITVTQQ